MSRKNRFFQFAVLLIGLAPITPAQTTAPGPKPGSGPGPPPPYSVVRWNEDYSYLNDPNLRTDFLDPIKYIPLNDSGDFYLSLGGQARYRYEYFNNANFGAGTQDADGYHLLRFLAHADLHLGPNVRLFVQGKSSLIEDGGIGPGGDPRPIDADELDVQQAFADLTLPLGDKNSLLLRFGRQDLLYGAQRLISPLDWTNTRRTFEGFKTSLTTGPNTLDLFWVRLVDVEREEFNNGDPNTSFAGIYDVLAIPGLVAKDDNSKLDLYGLALNRTNARFAQNAAAATPTADEDRYTLGIRLSGNPKPFDFDLEGDYQFGQFGRGDISAWAFAAEGGYTLAQAPFAPRLFLGFDIASGDRDPANPDLQTFNQLAPLGHAYLGYIDVVGRQNIIDLHPGVELTLAQNFTMVKKLTLRSEYHLFWRESTDDALYNVAAGIATAPPVAGVQRAAGGSNSSYVGSELDLLLNWQIDRHTAAYVGYSHFFAGDFIDDTAGTGGFNEDIDFFYAAVAFTF